MHQILKFFQILPNSKIGYSGSISNILCGDYNIHINETKNATYLSVTFPIFPKLLALLAGAVSQTLLMRITLMITLLYF